MDRELWVRLLADATTVPGGEGFLEELFSSLVKELKAEEEDSVRKILLEEFEGLSRHLDRSKVQDSCTVRALLRAKRLAALIFTEEGKIDEKPIQEALQVLRHHLYPLGPGRLYDEVRLVHLFTALERLAGEPKLRKKLEQIETTRSNTVADELLRETLQVDAKTSLKPFMVRRAFLSAWLAYLRQNVGSCFATAPAILIHEEQPEQFIEDLKNLLTIGRLTRVTGGVEYSAPINGSSGAGDLKKPFLFYYDPAREFTPIWESPGFILALSKAGLLGEEKSLPKRIKRIQDLLKESFDEQPEPFYSTVEELISRILKKKLNLTDDIIEDQTKKMQLRSRGPLLGGLVKKEDKQPVEEYKRLQDAAAIGFKSLTEHPLLRSWEFTLASFSEVKPTLSRYNMYKSLGFDPKEPDGIGANLYKEVSTLVERQNQETKERQEDYESAYLLVQHVEGRLRRASSEEAEWLKSDYRARVTELQNYQSLRDESHEKAQRFANLFQQLMNLYEKQFVNHFQEVYDPDIREVSLDLYDDSPAGFRLLYKGGRGHQWERIEGPDQFAESLANFFIATEQEITRTPECEGIEQEVSRLITSLVNHVRTTEFMESALQRLAQAHGERLVANPLQNLDKVKKKPWVYTSGGTMGSLITAYFKLEDKPEERDRWVENPTELLAFFLDTVRQLPKDRRTFLEKNPDTSLLIHSPTHAFLLKPHFPFFKRGWASNGGATYTYTWIKEELVGPSERFIDSIRLDEAAIHYLLNTLREKLPKEFHHAFNRAFYRTPSSCFCSEFRQYVAETIDRDRRLQIGRRSIINLDEVDSLLYRELPLVKGMDLRERLGAILRSFTFFEPKVREQLFEEAEMLLDLGGRQEMTGAAGFREFLQAVLMVHFKKTRFEKPLYRELVAHLRREGAMMPEPLIVADTNWVKDYFAFLVNPGTGKLDFWRVDALGLEGAPLSNWREWINGKRKDRTWGIYTNPFQYRA